VLLHRYLEQDDVVIGSLVSGRSRVETEQLIGCFANPLPLRVRLHDGLTLRDVVHEARRTMTAALDHQDVPFDRLVEQLGLGPESARTSFSPIWINVLTVPDMTLDLPGLRITPQPMPPAKTSVDLTLNVIPSGDRLLMQWHYMTELFDAGTVALLAEQFHRVLRQVVTAPDMLVRDVEFDTPFTVDQPSTVDRPAAPQSGVGFVELFARRVALAPYAPAVICDGVATSYGELNRDANRLAHRLRALGVGRDTRVGILVNRSPQLAVAILGVLKAGGAYVPLDPTYPPQRMAFMLDDAGARVLVTQRELAGVPDAGSPRHTVLVDESEPGVADTDPTPPPDPAALA
jgi:non-ribosomal peptide synthetase component F